MARDEWKEHYEPDKVKEYYDLSGDQTAFAESQFDLKDDDEREQYEEIETQFIDELYGTDNAEWSTENKKEGAFWDDDSGFDSTWGLDLRRTMKDEDGEDINPSDSEYYEHLTRGEVDWASYENDPAYIKAFEAMKEAGDLPEVGPRHKSHDPNSIDFLTSNRKWKGSKIYSDQMKADWVRKARTYIEDQAAEDEAEDKWKTEWEGQYDKDKIYRDDEGNLFMPGEDGKPERQKTLKELYEAGEGRLTVNEPGEITPIVKPTRTIGRPDIPGVVWTKTGKGYEKPSLAKITQVKTPGNIPKEWGKDVAVNPQTTKD